MKMIYFITLILCFNNLIRLDEAINHYDIQSSDSKDLVKEDGTEPYEGEVIYSDESGKIIKSKQFEVYFYI